MSSVKVMLLGGCLAASVGCAEFSGERSEAPVTKDGERFYREETVPLEFFADAETGLTYAAEPTSATATIFLVAGSLRGANFAQEVIEQKRLWLERGAAEKDIACYFVIPDKPNFTSDEAQYRSLAPELKSCRLASMQALAADLRAAAAAKPEHVYFYVTSHGDRRMSDYAQHNRSIDQDDEADKIEWLIGRYPALDRYMIALDSTPSGTANLGMQLDAIDMGVSADDILLTPNSLNAALTVFSPETRKTVVMQGCYSGGFIDPAVVRTPQDNLSATPRITVLTAASAFRPSFGCGVDDLTTYFGGALLESLRESDKALPGKLDWSALYGKTKAKVEALESAQGFKPSEPAYYSNR